MFGKRMVTSIFLLLVTLMATASAAEFSADVSAAQASACPTDTLLYVLTVTNTGATADAYTVSLSGDAAHWAVAAPAGFTLAASGKQEVYLYVTPPVSAGAGAYNLDILVTSQTNKKAYSTKVNVANCHSIAMTAAEAGKNSCTNTQTQFQVNVANTGRYAETLALSLTGAGAKYATLSHAGLQLNANQSADVTVTVNTDKGVVGSYPITLNARAKTANAVASQQLAYESKSCYDFDISLDKNYLSFCEASEAKIPVTISNRGEKDEAYDLKLVGPEWASLETSSLQASAAGSATTNLVLFPKFGVAGNFKATLTAKGRESGAESSANVDANVLQCHATDLRLSANYDTVCPYTTKAYTISLINAGKVTENYAVSVVGPEFASVDRNFVALSTANMAQLNLIVAPKAETTGLKTVKVIAESQDPSHTSSSATLNLNIAPQSSCFGVKTTLALSDVRVARGEGALVPIVIENAGSQDSTYTLEISGSGASLAQLNPRTVTLKGNEAKTLQLYVSAPLETQQQEYKLTVSARSADNVVSSSSPLTVKIYEKAEPTTVVVEPPKPATPEPTGAVSGIPQVGERVNKFFEGLRTRLIDYLKNLKTPEIKTPQLQTKVNVTQTPARTNATATTAQTNATTNVSAAPATISKPAQTAASVSDVKQEIKTVFAKSEAVRTEVRSNAYEAKQAVAGIASVSDARRAVSYLFWYMKQRYQGVPYVVYYGAGLAVLGFLIGVGMGLPHTPRRPAAATPVQTATPTQASSGQKGIWQKFVDFLEEDDEDLEKPKS
jgi:uncharacterized membrane protein